MRGPAQAHRAGRGHRRPLRQPGHRAAPPGAGHQRGAARLGAGARRACARRPRSAGAALIDELAETSRRAYRALVWEDPRLRDLLPGGHAHRGAGGPRHRLAPGGPRRGAAVAPGGTARSSSCAPSPGSSPGRSRAPTCPAGTASAAPSRPTSATTASRGTGAPARALRAVAVLRQRARQRRDEPRQGGHAGRAPLRGPGARRPRPARIWRRIRAEYRRTVGGHPAGHRPRPPAGRDAGAAALDRAAQPVRRLALGAPGAAAGPPARAAAGRPGARELLRLVHLTVSGVAAGVQNTG